MPKDDLRTAQQFLDDNSTLHRFLAAGGEVVDIVIQDEFTHDVVARLPASLSGESNALLVVFDST